MTIEAYRRFFAQEVEAACGLRTPALVEAFATIPRERFLDPGPWTLRGADGDFMGGAGRLTPDADPKRVYHNVAIAIDASRQLFNGQPGTIGAWIDQLALGPGARVLHIGAGTGYFTAVMAHCVGASGRVVAYEADAALASRARANLAPGALGALDLPAIEVRHGDATAVDGEFDAILVNAGVTHPLDAWLDALATRGRLVVPITFAFGAMPISKGVVALVSQRDGGFDARSIGFVAIYVAVGVRDQALNDSIGVALKTNPMPRLASLRRDPHERSSSCWLHGESFCLETAPAGVPTPTAGDSPSGPFSRPVY